MKRLIHIVLLGMPWHATHALSQQQDFDNPASLPTVTLLEDIDEHDHITDEPAALVNQHKDPDQTQPDTYWRLTARQWARALLFRWYQGINWTKQHIFRRNE